MGKTVAVEYAAAQRVVSACPHDAQAYKAACGAAVREYFASGQAGEVAAALQDLRQPRLGHVLVKQVSLGVSSSGFRG